jgi:hypothetical protein
MLLTVCQHDSILSAKYQHCLFLSVLVNQLVEVFGFP